MTTASEFPGEIAGASLKHIGLELVIRPRAGIPRRNRRGLIEAARRVVMSRPAERKFPGEIAGASLKRPDGSVHAGVAGVKFPGEIAGASLKPIFARSVVAWVVRKFPGEIAGASLKRPGPELPARTARPNSPAKSPGPH